MFLQNKFIAQEFHEDNFQNFGQLPYTECLQHMQATDILLIIQPDTRTQIPSKFYEYIYLNKPILTIASKDVALGKMIVKYEFGNIFEPDDIEGIAEYLLTKLSEKEQTGLLKNNYKQRDLFDVINISKHFEDIIS